MKITRRQLRRIIKEEVHRLFHEAKSEVLLMSQIGSGEVLIHREEGGDKPLSLKDAAKELNPDDPRSLAQFNNGDTLAVMGP